MMNRKREHEEDGNTLSCPVCEEHYTLQAGGRPRIFPCMHSICQKCLEEMLNEENFLCTCPTCRKQHSAISGARSFPENQYLISMLQYIEYQEGSRFRLCEKHSRELSLFCREEGCGVPVCQLCLLREHSGHRVVDLIEEHSEKLEDEILGLSKDRFVQQISFTKNKKCLEILLRRKAETENRFNEMIDATRRAITKSERKTDQLDAEIYRFSELRAKIIQTGTEGREESRAIEEIIFGREIDDDQEGFTYFQFKKTDDPCGTLEEKRVSVPKLTETLKFDLATDRVVYLIEELSDGNLAVYTKPRNNNSTRTSTPTASSSNGEGTSTGPNADDFFLSRYSGAGKLRFSMRMEHSVHDMAEVTLLGKPCLAVCVKSQKQIEFRDLQDWKSVLYVYCAGPNTPGFISSLNNSTLLVESETPDGNNLVIKLHCVTTPLIKSEFVMKMPKGIDMDMCCQGGEDQTQVIAVDINSVHAFEFPSGRKKWNLGVYLLGLKWTAQPQQITIDGRGHLFVTDEANSCIHMLTTEGRYLGALLRDVHGSPYAINWSKQTSSLIVNFSKDDTDVVRVFKIEM